MRPSSYTLFDSLGLGKDTEFCIHGWVMLWLQKEKYIFIQSCSVFWGSELCNQWDGPPHSFAVKQEKL